MTHFPETIQLTLNLVTIPPIMKRGSHVLILLIDENNHFVLGKKDLYPTGIQRLVGGGTEGEEPTTAALRELREEVGLSLSATDLQPLAQVVAEVTNSDSVTPVTFTTYLFATHVQRNTLTPADDLDGLATLTPSDMHELIKRYQQLPSTIDPDLGFAWADYGQLYGRMHEIALQTYQKYA